MWNCLCKFFFFFFTSFYLVFVNLEVYAVNLYRFLLAGSLVCTGIEATACDLWGALWVLPPPTIATTSSEHSTAGVMIPHIPGKSRQRSHARNWVLPR